MTNRPHIEGSFYCPVLEEGLFQRELTTKLNNAADEIGPC
jgi:hypothetical protein